MKKKKIGCKGKFKKNFIYMIINIFYLFRNKPGIRGKASNEDTDTEIRFALLKPEGSN